MIAQVRAELLKQRSTQTTLALLGGMFAIVSLAIILHVMTPTASDLATRSDQIPLFEAGTRIGMLFAAIAGALVITTEFRFGTIHPTFLVTPKRSPAVAAKIVVSAVVGLAFGLVAEALMAGAATAALNGRGITVELTSGDYTRLLIGGAIATAAWAMVGFGLGALVRNQIPTLIGLAVYLLLIDHLLPASAARYTPGFAGLGLAIDAAHTQLADSVPSVAVAVTMLATCCVAITTAGWWAILRRDAA
jgi:hypothetical protein